MSEYSKILEELAEFSEITSSIKSNITPISVSGVSDSVRAHLIFCVCQKLKKGALVIARSQSEISDIYNDLSFFFGEDKVIRFNNSELMFHDAEAKAKDVLNTRLSVLKKLLTEPDGLIVVTSPEALLSATVPQKIWSESSVSLKSGDEIELEDLCQRLSNLGYRREDMTEGAGQFSVRGGIVDIFPCTEENPYRIEFFDTEVDSVRIFDIETQRTIEMVDKVDICPSGEILLSDKQVKSLCSALQKLSDDCDTSTDRGKRAFEVLSRDIERLQNGLSFPSIDKYIPHIYKGKIPTLIDYIPNDFLVFMDEPSYISEHIKRIESERAERVTSMYSCGLMANTDDAFSLPYLTGIKLLERHPFITTCGLTRTSSEIRAKRMYTLSSKSLSGFKGKPELLRESLEYYKKNMYKTVILAGTSERASNLCNALNDDNIKCSYQKTLEKLPAPGGIVVCGGSVSRSFEYTLIRTVIIGDREIFGGEKKKKRRPLYRGKKGAKISDFTSLNPGDYVVHRNHGVALYSGIEQLTVDGVRKDYLKLTYKNGDTLYVPTDQLDIVYRYDKKEGARVKLNSLGGTDWEKTRLRVKKSAQDMAKKLIALYSARTNMPGISFSPDTEWQKSLEAAFPYEETDDQLRSIDEIKADMEKPYPMDRLLCGDVGYGKTEVALRAAFKAVMSGYQVAYLVPTTILANQHFNTFKQRMMDYPVNIDMLSRFRTPKGRQKTIKTLSTGETDIVIGTHTLLSKNVEFKNLGLLIIDEEQRFGVSHKEKIKELRKNVDVLTLSATPIPRTLNMSLTGIRDMSIINSPPGERYPVETYVAEYDEFIAKEAIDRELSRNGQVYYLKNRIDEIFKTANKLAELVPTARIAVIHSKMSEAEIERVMMEVSEGEIDVLVCTTIIETGLDIPNVNTIIVEDADRLGLSQMYQLRGRVGRSNRLAYAYLTFRRNKNLTEEAEKRLLAMKEFTEFGSGFKIAMRDLEIRGTGNLIGAEQHGHMESVGYEMYCRLLEEAVNEEKGLEPVHQTETSVDLPVSAYIPESYITDHSRRIGAYKKIASITDRDSLYDVYDEIEDRYGAVTPPVANLMEISLIKKTANSLGIKEIIGNAEQVVMRFDEEATPNLQYVVDYMTSHPKEMFVTNPKNPRLHLKLSKPVPREEENYLKKIHHYLGIICGEIREK